MICRITLKMDADAPGSESPTLAELRPGQEGVIESVGSLRDGLRRRLLELGFVPGAQLRVVKRAPLGDPLQVTVHGYHLSIRRADARAVRMRVSP